VRRGSLQPNKYQFSTQTSQGSKLGKKETGKKFLEVTVDKNQKNTLRPHHLTHSRAHVTQKEGGILGNGTIGCGDIGKDSKRRYNGDVACYQEQKKVKRSVQGCKIPRGGIYKQKFREKKRLGNGGRIKINPPRC